MIDNVQALRDTQFDSNIRSTGHSYNKYNNWEMVKSINMLPFWIII